MKKEITQVLQDCILDDIDGKSLDDVVDALKVYQKIYAQFTRLWVHEDSGYYDDPTYLRLMGTRSEYPEETTARLNKEESTKARGLATRASRLIGLQAEIDRLLEEDK